MAGEGMERQTAAREKERLDDRRRRCRALRERRRERYRQQRFEVHESDDTGADDGRFVYARVDHSAGYDPTTKQRVPHLIQTVRVNAARCVQGSNSMSFASIGPGLIARNKDLTGRTLSPETLFISDFRLRPLHQNSGIGSAIMDIFFAYVDKMAVNAVYGDLSNSDIEAEAEDGHRGIDEGRRDRLIHFYTKFGFDVTWFETLHGELWGRIDWRRGHPRPGRLLHTP